MPDAEVRWRLQGGFSQLVEGTHVELLLTSKPARGVLDAVPLELLKGRGAVDLDFRAARTFRVRGPGGLRWELGPEGRIEARLLCADSAFLGNFRVPAGHYGVQWTVIGRVSGVAKRPAGPFLVQATAGSWINYTWVDMATADAAPRESLLAAWAGFRDLFDPEQILLATSRQVCQLSWTGRVRLAVRLDLDLIRGWQAGTILNLFEVETRLRAGVELGLQARLEREGNYTLRVQRKGAKIRLNLRRQNSRDRTVGIEVGVSGTSRVTAGATAGLLDPALEPIRDQLEKGVARRLELMLAMEASDWGRKRTLVEAEWTAPTPREFGPGYRRLLEGDLPPAAPGFKASSLIETLSGRRTRIAVSFLNWFTLGTERSRQHRTAVRIDALGNLLVEEGWQVEETRYRWDERQFFRLLAEGRMGREPLQRWLSGLEGSLSREELQRTLRAALHCGAVDSVSIPGGRSFPLDLKVVWATELSEGGVEALRRTDGGQRWEALVRSLELAEPARYRRGSFWRDWIESAEVRAVADRDPLQSHLETVYPLGGRSEAQRRLVLAEYRRCRSFLRLFDAWAGDRGSEPVELARSGLSLPIFLFVHVLCPAPLRRSVVVLSGGIEAVWGDRGLWEEIT